MKKILCLLFVILVCSCASQKRFVYFQPGEEIFPEQRMSQQISNPKEIRIQPNDILAITVNSVDGQAANPYNLVRSDMPNNNQPINDFLVDKNGDVSFPGLGNVKLAGLTMNEAKNKLKQSLEPYLKDAVINMRFVNFSITVMGEVQSPASYRVSGERITVIEALGLAGDITDFGDRENIMVIREKNGLREFGQINMLSDSIFESKHFYLIQNDVVYVPPNKAKSFSASSQPTSRVLLPILGFLTSVASLIIVANK